MLPRVSISMLSRRVSGRLRTEDERRTSGLKSGCFSASPLLVSMWRGGTLSEVGLRSVALWLVCRELGESVWVWWLKKLAGSLLQRTGMERFLSHMTSASNTEESLGRRTGEVSWEGDFWLSSWPRLSLFRMC